MALRALTAAVLPALLFASGATALALEVLWIRDFALLFGGTAPAAAMVLSAYFAGLALGARLGGRIRSRGLPLRSYAGLVGGAAALAACYVLLRPALPALAASLTRSTPPALLPAARTLLALAVLLAPTTLLGATLPVAAAAATSVRAAGRLYAWNTLGGAAGALATSFLVLPALGMRRTFLAAAALDLAVAATAWAFARRAPAATWTEAPARTRGEAPRPRLAAAVAAISGAVALAAEVLWARGLSGVLSGSVYSVALVLTAVLLGIVAGTAIALRVLGRPGRLEPRLAVAAAVAAAGVLVSLPALRALPGISLALVGALGGGAAAGLAVEAILALHVVFVPSAAIGTLLPITLGLGDSLRPGETMAGPLAASTAGGIIGSLAGAFVLLPRLGLGGGLLILTAVLLVLAAALASRRGARVAAACTAAAIAVAAVVAPPLPFPWRAGPADRVLYSHDGPTATVLVTADAQGHRRLRINGQYSLGGGDGLFLERREALLPLLLHRDPRRLLHLGVGTGDTLGAALASPGLQGNGVELVAEALDAAALFAADNGDVIHNPRARLVADDARSFLLDNDARWDVILVDLVLPWTAGAAGLFSRDFYQLALAHLAPGGLVCQWLPLHQLSVDDLERIVATFTSVFPHVQLWVAYHRSLTPLAALVGSPEPLAADAGTMRARLSDPAFAAMARSVGLDDPDGVGLLYVTDGVHLRAATRDVAPITDDRPTIEFSAPRAYYHQDGLGAAALAWIAARLDPAAAPVVGAPPAPFALRANLLRAQLALLAGDRPDELRAYLDALALAPDARPVQEALAAIAQERRGAGDPVTANAVMQAMELATARAAHGGDRPAPTSADRQ
jgi:spermidine synthase